MTDHPNTPPQDKDLIVFGGVVYRWWEEACKKPPSSFYEKLNYLAAKATKWGWQERDASVPGELQQARDQELDACCDWLIDNQNPRWGAALRTARRPKPPSLAEEALETLMQADGAGLPVPVLVLHCDELAKIRRALKRLQELEGQGDG